MKKITLFLLLLTASIGYSQVILEDFEGTAPEIGASDGVIASISSTQSIGTKSLEMISAASGQPWQQAELLLQGDWIDLTTDKTATAEVYSTTAFNLLAKVIMPADGGPESAASDSHTGSGWETLTFNFAIPEDGTGIADDSYQKVLFLPNWAGGNSGNNSNNSDWNNAIDGTYYIDNFSGIAAAASETCSDGIQNNEETAVDCGGPNCDACPVLPTTAAPTPPVRNAGDVVSIFSDAYADLASNFDAGWCGGNSVETIQIEGNNIVAFKGNNCQGIVLPAGIDITSYTNMHVDVYIEESVDVESKVFNLKFVQQPGGAALEVNFNAGSSPALVAGSWISIDVQVDLAIFTGFKEFGITADNLKNQVWYDNLYIYRAATASVSDNELLNVSMYPNPASDVLNISAANTIKNASIFNVLGKKVMSLDINKNSESIDVSSLASGIYLIKYQLNDATGTAKFIKE